MANWSPYEHAEQHGIRVEHAAHLGGHLGRWYPRSGTIVLLDGLPALQERSVLAHELGHAMLGHTTSSAKRERQADRWAARHLIRYEHFDRTRRYADDPSQWCVDLLVTPRILKAWIDDHPDVLRHRADDGAFDWGA